MYIHSLKLSHTKGQWFLFGIAKITSRADNGQVEVLMARVEV